MHTQEISDEAAEARAWMQKLSPYRVPDAARSWREIAITAIPFVAGWAGMMYAVLNGHFWLYALLMLPTAALLVRLFMIQHDCGHLSFFPGKGTNDWIGRVLGVLTLTPYDFWRYSHGVHHAGSGNLDRRGIGDVATLTVAEFEGKSRLGRLAYRLYRHPLVLFGLGPAYVFILQSRLPFGFMKKGWMPWLSTMSTNLGLAIGIGLLVWAFGLVPFLLVYLPVVLIAASAGVWLFYVQHQFEETHWAEGQNWNVHEAALHGSSHYDLPPVLTWFTANIGVHHVHHLSSRIPFYRLQQVLRDFPELRDIGRITLIESLACPRLVLWDESRRRLVSFKEASRHRASVGAPAEAM